MRPTPRLPRRVRGPGSAFAHVACALLVLIGSLAHAQHVTFAVYGLTSGLSNLNINAVLEDRSGLIWTATENGVFTADGTRFTRQQAFAQAGLDDVRVLIQDAAGRIWALDGHHLAFWQNGIVHTIPGLNLNVLINDASELMVLPSDRDAIYLLRDAALYRVASADGGTTWVTSPALSTSLLVLHPQLQRLTSITDGRDGTVWAGCDQSLCRLNLARGTVRVLAAAEGVPPDTWQRLLLSRSGILWARGRSHVIQAERGTLAFTQPRGFAGTTGLSADPFVLTEDPAGAILLGLANGLARITPGGWKLFNATNGLPDEGVSTLFFDHAGNLWIGIEGHGLARWLSYGESDAWTKAEGLRSNLVWSIAHDAAGHTWVGTDMGLDRLDPAATRLVPESLPEAAQRVSSTALDLRGHLWIGGSNGDLVDIDPQTGTKRVAATGLQRIFQIFSDQRQRIWICSRGGLYFVNPDDFFTVHQVRTGDVSRGYARSITESPDGTLWVTTGQGLFRLQGEHWTTIDTSFRHGDTANFLLTAARDGTLWVQSRLPFPLVHIRVDGNATKVLDQVSDAIFASDNITFISTDRRGWIWVGTDDGVQVFNGQRWVQFTEEDGLIWNDTDFQAFYADPDGSVWIGTSGGVTHLIRPERLFAIPPPTLQLAGAHLGDATIEPGPVRRFDLRRPTLIVPLLNTNYSRAHAIVYRYRLEGQEKETQETGAASLRFPALPPGAYTVDVAAYDRQLHASSSVRSLSFIVLEPWWNRTWAHLLEGGCLALLILALWRFSIHLLVARQQELEMLVTARTQELQQEKRELLRARGELIEINRHDALTGLLNRATIFQILDRECSLALQNETPLAVVMADLDSFKHINDLYGHVVGDTVLRQCAARIQRTIRPIDAVGRYGGEEMMILMPGLTRDGACARLEELRVAIAGEPIRHGTLLIQVTCSFGVAWSTHAACSNEELIGLADAALYKAKQNGRNRVEYALPPNPALTIFAGAAPH